MYKIDSDIVFMCRTYTEIQLHTSILVLLLEQVRTLGRAKARLGRRQDVLLMIISNESMDINLHQWQKFYTGSDGRDISHL